MYIGKVTLEGFNRAGQHSILDVAVGIELEVTVVH